MVQQVEETHAEEEEHFRKLQVQDAASLNDRLDTLIVIIFYFIENFANKMK